MVVLSFGSESPAVRFVHVVRPGADPETLEEDVTPSKQVPSRGPIWLQVLEHVDDMCRYVYPRSPGTDYILTGWRFQEVPELSSPFVRPFFL